MPVLNPETLFDTRQAVENENGVIISGMWWYGQYYTTQPGQNDCYLKTVDLWEVSGDELTALDPTAHYDAATGIKKTLFTFGSGVDFCVSIYAKSETIGTDTYTSVHAAGCIKYNNTYYYNIGGLSDAGGLGIGQTISYNPVNLAKTYGLKFCAITNYTYGLGQAIVDQTKAAYFDIMAHIPGTNTGSASGFQSWQHIHAHSTYFSSRKDDPDISDWEYNPQYFWYMYGANTLTTYNPVLRTGNLETFYNALKAINPYLPDPFKIVDGNDPSQETDPSGPGGGGGNMDPSSDPIDFPSLPVGGALTSGAIKAFDVTPAAVTQMFLKLWDDSIFDITTFQKLVESPLDSLVQFQCVPIAPHTNGTAHIMLGNFDTEAVADVIDREYYTIDCGTLTVEEFWGSALDYNPYTEATLWVPMCGFRDVDINDIMGKKIHLKYNYSIFDGNLTAQLMCGQSVLYKWPGNVRETIPVTQRVNDALQRIASGAGAVIGGAVAGGGAGAVTAAIGAAINVAFSQTHVSRSGALEGSTGLLDEFTPYLIIKRPIQSLAAGFKTQKGYPSNISAVLNTCSGYTEVEYIHLTGITGATDTELNDIERLLKEGVII